MCLCKTVIKLRRHLSNNNIIKSLSRSPLRHVQVRRLSSTTGIPPSDPTSEESKTKRLDVSPLTFDKYGIFRDEESPIILDIEEERLKARQRTVEVIDEFQGIRLERGLEGVFDIEELVELLKKDNAQDVFVAKLPPHLKYVNHIVIVTGKSQRHMLALAEFVRKVFKRKKHTYDLIPKIEGENSKDWIAMDLGNIALHIFSKSTRKVYDLESLWSVGPQYDELCNKPEDPLVELLERHSVYLGDLKPRETHG